MWPDKLTYDEDWEKDSTGDGQRDGNSNKNVLWKERKISHIILYTSKMIFALEFAYPNNDKENERDPYVGVPPLTDKLIVV